MPPSYRQTLAHLYRLRRFGMRPGLEVMQALLEHMGHPEHAFPAIHVAGSKGKGSVSAFASSILSAAGLRTGLFTSPHLQSFRERVQIDRKPISPTDVVRGIERVQSAVVALEASGSLPRPPTFFETTTALAFDYFQRSRVDAAVVEVGIGGRLDSTNVLRSTVGVITTIELEHTEILGNRLEEIAREKAGILHPGMTAVVSEPKPIPRREIEREAALRGVPLWHLGKEVRWENRKLSAHGQQIDLSTPMGLLPRLSIPLQGTFQARNAASAIAAVQLFGRAIGHSFPERAIREGIAATRWRGRLERLERRPPLYIDVAHTPESCEAVAESLTEIDPLTDPAGNVLVFGCLAGKRPAEMLSALSRLFRTIIAVPVRSDRTVPADEVARLAAGRFPVIVKAPSLAAALPLARAATRPGGFALVTGSDYLVGETLDAVEGRAADEPDLSDPVTTAAPPPPEGSAPKPMAGRR
jgi:dihydrofolate synthase / folylpolyglutamate synthase